ncbi:MAG: hypothetical protein ACK5IJ_08300 [Mangrovibacterium sp.]
MNTKLQYIYAILIIVACSFWSSTTIAQEIKITASVDSSNVLIGDQLHLKFEIEQPKGLEILLPTFIDTITKSVEVAEVHPIDTISEINDDVLKFVQEITIQSFDTGRQIIPAQEFKFLIDTAVHVINSKPVPFHVHSGFNVDSISAPINIKKPYEAPINLAEASPYLLGAILLAAIIFFIFYYINYLAKRKKEQIEEGPKDPAHIIALRELDRIKTSELWKEDDSSKEYFSELSDAMRTYVENRFQINAMECTTMEIMQAFKIQKGLLDQKTNDQLKSILELADLVKFAKFKPNADECERCLSLAFLFVKDTMTFETEKNNTEDDSHLTESKTSSSTAANS